MSKPDQSTESIKPASNRKRKITMILLFVVILIAAVAYGLARSILKCNSLRPVRCCTNGNPLLALDRG
jgi:hypothetical protein